MPETLLLVILLTNKFERGSSWEEGLRTKDICFWRTRMENREQTYALSTGRLNTKNLCFRADIKKNKQVVFICIVL